MHPPSYSCKTYIAPYVIYKRGEMQPVLRDMVVSLPLANAFICRKMWIKASLPFVHQRYKAPELDGRTARQGAYLEVYRPFAHVQGGRPLRVRYP